MRLINDAKQGDEVNLLHVISASTLDRSDFLFHNIIDASKCRCFLLLNFFKAIPRGHTNSKEITFD
jgi:hypothetical protein